MADRQCQSAGLIPISTSWPEHAFEALYVGKYPEVQAYPGEDVIAQFLEQECFPAFEEYVGIPYADSLLWMLLIGPSVGTWSLLDDRSLSCYLYEEEPSGSRVLTTGSLKDARR